MDYLIILIVIALALYLRESAINSYKISYYEQKLKNRGVDIEHVRNISLTQIINQ